MPEPCLWTGRPEARAVPRPLHVAGHNPGPNPRPRPNLNPIARCMSQATTLAPTLTLGLTLTLSHDACRRPRPPPRPRAHPSLGLGLTPSPSLSLALALTLILTRTLTRTLILTLPRPRPPSPCLSARTSDGARILILPRRARTPGEQAGSQAGLVLLLTRASLALDRAWRPATGPPRSSRCTSRRSRCPNTHTHTNLSPSP